MDKAGAYGIQGAGAFLIKKVDGDYGTVVGLPVSIVFRKLREYTLLQSN
jgi:septum formation protein